MKARSSVSFLRSSTVSSELGVRLSGALGGPSSDSDSTSPPCSTGMVSGGTSSPEGGTASVLGSALGSAAAPPPVSGAGAEPTSVLAAADAHDATLCVVSCTATAFGATSAPAADCCALNLAAISARRRRRSSISLCSRSSSSSSIISTCSSTRRLYSASSLRFLSSSSEISRADITGSALPFVAAVRRCAGGRPDGGRVPCSPVRASWREEVGRSASKS
mmetsp:Transcript_29701/g.91155  ORF Transcript_29701/g.91155 Transcript_29701/m.91155 type:complete len:220 (+) Transcript_29701:1794-2453(+)